MNITEILKKLAKGDAITEAEKALLLANKEILSDDQVKAIEAAEVEAEEEEVVEDEEEDEEEVVDEKSMEKLISKSLQKSIDSITDQLAEKFIAGAETARTKAIDTGKKVKKTGDEETRDFMKALFNGDRDYLKANSGLTDAAGGYLIPEELRSEVLRIAEDQYGLARRDMRYLPFTGPGNERKIPALATSVATFWTDEAAQIDSTAPAFSIVTQTMKKLAAIVPMTEEILEDSTINLTALVAELFAEAVAKEEDLQFFNGDGTVWTGILNNGSVNIVNTATTNPADVTAEDLLSLIDAMPTGALAGSKFYMSRTVFSKIRSLREDAVTEGDAAGAYLVTAPTATAPATMWGYPIEVSDALPAITVGNSEPFVMFGNLQRAAIFGDKQQLRVKMLDQATIRNVADSADINLAAQDMVAVRIVERVGYVLALPAAISVLKTVAA
jgi:HK97 family phage major capsid protein